MNKIFLSCLILVLCAGFSLAQEVKLPCKSRYGALTVSSENLLQLNGKTIRPTIYIDEYGSHSMKKYMIKDKDVYLIAQPNGNSCPGNYVYLTVSKRGTKVTPPFGTCMDWSSNPVFHGESISFEMENYSGSGETRYTYKNGIVTEQVRH